MGFNDSGTFWIAAQDGSRTVILRDANGNQATIHVDGPEWNRYFINGEHDDDDGDE